MVRIHSSFFRAENAQIIILLEIPEKGIAGRKEGYDVSIKTVQVKWKN